jgi:hypothetical protein
VKEKCTPGVKGRAVFRAGAARASAFLFFEGPGLCRLGKRGDERAKNPKSIPQGLNGWVRTYPYQGALIFSYLRHG